MEKKIEKKKEPPFELEYRDWKPEYLYSYGELSPFFRELVDHARLMGSKCPKCGKVYSGFPYDNVLFSRAYIGPAACADDVAIGAPCVCGGTPDPDRADNVHAAGRCCGGTWRSGPCVRPSAAPSATPRPTPRGTATTIALTEMLP